jgi:hypothetical protein
MLANFVDFHDSGAPARIDTARIVSTAFILVYIVCDALDHRIGKSPGEGNEKEEFECGSTRMNYGPQEERSNDYHRGRLSLTIAWLRMSQRTH